MIYLIVPVHNDAPRLKKFVKCLNAQTVKPFVIYVDSSTDNTNAEVVGDSYMQVWLRVPKHNYWAGMLKHAQRWIATEYKFGQIDVEDIVGVMNNDVTFGPDYFAIVQRNSGPSVILSSQTQTCRGATVDWGRFRFDQTNNGPFDCFENRGVFLTVENFLRVKFHPFLLPHYASDYAWTYKTIQDGLIGFVPRGLKLTVDLKTTGIVEPKSIREIFSIRYGGNPIYNTVFILLYCPWKYKPVNILRVWGYAIVRIARLIRR